MNEKINSLLISPDLSIISAMDVIENAPPISGVSGIAVVVDTNYKIIHRITLLILKSLRPMPCASNQCISASQIVASANFTVPMPFIFRQRPLP